MIVLRRLYPWLLVVLALATLGAWFVNERSSPYEPAAPAYTGGLDPWDPGMPVTADQTLVLKRVEPLSTQELRDLQRDYGVEVVDRLPRFGYIVRVGRGGTQALLQTLDKRSDLTLHRLQAKNRLSEELAAPKSQQALLGPPGGDLRYAVLVTFHKHVTRPVQRQVLEGATGVAHFEARIGPDGGITWRAELTKRQMNALAERDEVRWLEAVGPPPTTDLHTAVPSVEGESSRSQDWTLRIGQVEPCIPLPGIAAIGGRVRAVGEVEIRCRRLVTDRDPDPDHLDEWPLWFDDDGDGEGDDCVWGNCDIVADEAWQPVEMDAVEPRANWPEFLKNRPPRLVHRSDEYKATDHHVRICSTDLADLNSGCTQPSLTEPDPPPVVWPQAIDAGSSFVDRCLLGYSPLGHATNMAGIMIGNGDDYPIDTDNGQNVNGAGLATKAKTVSAAIGVDGSRAPDAYANLKSVEAAEDEVAVVNNSWGRYYYTPDPPGLPSRTYDYLSRLYDTLTSGRVAEDTPDPWPRRVSIVGSAGNAGIDPAVAPPGDCSVGDSEDATESTDDTEDTDDAGNSDIAGQCDEDNIAPKWGRLRIGNSAKNTISVGNVDDDHCLQASSSRGPTYDGRIAPLISAVGTDVTAAFPESPGEADYRALPAGTSQASAMVSAAASLAAAEHRDRCDLDIDGTNPALIRAILVHSATQKEEESDGSVGPDYEVGFGVLNVAGALALVEGSAFQTHEIDTGYVEYAVHVAPQDIVDSRIRVTLAWDDTPWPSGLSLGRYQSKLINDLDLELIDPRGRRHLPWVLDAANPAQAAMMASQTFFSPVLQSERDHSNTIEQVEVDDAVTGLWKVRVRSNRPYQQMGAVAPQPFVLVSNILASGADCGAIAPRERPIAIWWPTEEIPFYLVVLAIIVFLVLLVLLWSMVRPGGGSLATGAEVRAVGSITLFTLFVLLLALVFLCAYLWPLAEPVVWIGILAALIVIYFFVAT